MSRAALLVVVVVALAACSRAPEQSYPPDVVDAFVTSCRTKAPEATCRCTIDDLQRHVSLDEFKSLDRQARDGKIPKPLGDAISACASR
jgi:hypothetical protein